MDGEASVMLWDVGNDLGGILPLGGFSRGQAKDTPEELVLFRSFLTVCVAQHYR